MRLRAPVARGARPASSRRSSPREVERVRAPERASREAVAAFLHQVLARGFTDRADLLARAEELAIERSTRARSIVVARAHAHVTDRRRLARARARDRRARRARRGARRAVAALRERADAVGAEVVVAIPGADEDAAARAAEAIAARAERRAARPHVRRRAQPRGRPTRSSSTARATRRCSPPTSPRATPSARCSRSRRPAPTGCCSPAMSEDPAELQRFYAETVEPLVVYDEQYATDLVQTVEAFLDADGNVAGTAAQALHPPPHDPLPARARARAVRPRRRLDRRAREAQPGAEGDARAGHRGAAGRRPARPAGASRGANARAAEACYRRASFMRQLHRTFGQAQRIG